MHGAGDLQAALHGALHERLVVVREGLVDRLGEGVPAVDLGHAVTAPVLVRLHETRVAESVLYFVENVLRRGVGLDEVGPGHRNALLTQDVGTLVLVKC